MTEENATTSIHCIPRQRTAQDIAAGYATLARLEFIEHALMELRHQLNEYNAHGFSVEKETSCEEISE